MRADMAPPPRGPSARVAPLSSRWQRGAGLLQTRITRVMGHSVPSSHCRAETSRVVRNLVRTDSRLCLLALSICLRSLGLSKGRMAAGRSLVAIAKADL